MTVNLSDGFPLVLEIERPVSVAVLRGVVPDREGAAGNVSVCVHRENRGGVVALDVFDESEKAPADRMGVAQMIAAVALQAVADGAEVQFRRDSVENEVADVVGREIDGRVADEIGDLVIDVRPDRALQGNDPITVGLGLPSRSMYSSRRRQCPAAAR